MSEWTLMLGLIYIFSLVIGSFLNTIIYRLPLMLEAEQLSYLKSLAPSVNLSPKTTINFCKPLRSICPHCETTLSLRDNIPLFSYFLLKGRCRHCQQAIAYHYPLVEGLSLVLAILASVQFGFSLKLVFALAFIWFLIPLFFIDLQHLLLPDSLTLGLLWLGLLVNCKAYFSSLSDAVLGAALAYLSLWFAMQLYYCFRGKIGMGHGDFKLFAALGAWFGWLALPLILLISSLLGASIGSFYLWFTNKDKDSALAFGPYLCLAGLIYLFWGKAILNAYLKFSY